MSASERLKELRTSLGWTRKKFSEYFKIPYPTLTDWESGKNKMPDYIIELLEFRVSTEATMLSFADNNAQTRRLMAYVEKIKENEKKK